MGWFYGSKLHLLVNDQGQLLTFHLTAGHVDDRAPVPHLTQTLSGKLFADKVYLSQALAHILLQRGLQLITPLRKNMKNCLIPLMDTLLLLKRIIIETIHNQLKVFLTLSIPVIVVSIIFWSILWLGSSLILCDPRSLPFLISSNELALLHTF